MPNLNPNCPNDLPNACSEIEHQNSNAEQASAPADAAQDACITTLYALLKEYITDLRLEGKSQTTIDTYRPRCRAFCDWLTESLKIAEPTTTHFTFDNLRSFRLAIDDGRPRTICGNINALRSWNRWLMEKGLVAEYHAGKIPVPRLDPPERDLVSEEEVKRLFNALPLLPGPDAILHTAMLHVLCMCGTRRHEWLDLEIRGRGTCQKEDHDPAREGQQAPCRIPPGSLCRRFRRVDRRTPSPPPLP